MSSIKIIVKNIQLFLTTWIKSAVFTKSVMLPTKIISKIS
jgi:hypothetical protein